MGKMVPKSRVPAHAFGKYASSAATRRATDNGHTNRSLANTVDRPLVVSTEDMDDDTFILHMNHRHAGSLGGLRSLWRTARDGEDTVIDAWRIYHDRIHELHRVTIRHEHEL